jgi:RNA polymerase sigma-70 factor (ECF subfamily)
MAETLLIEADQRSPTDDDASLVFEAQRSLAGFKPLYEKWLGPVYRYFYTRTGNGKDAEDLTSQVFLKVYEQRPNFRSGHPFSAWLFAIVRHQAIDHYRRGTREVLLDGLNPEADSPDLLTQAIHSEEIECLHRLVGALPEEDQELIRLRFVAGLGYREIGLVLGRKEDAIRKSISRLLGRLQNQLENRHE